MDKITEITEARNKKLPDEPYNIRTYLKDITELKSEIYSIKEILKSKSEVATTIDGDDSMSDGLSETLFKEIKDDLREREVRTREEINEREKRFEKTLEKFAEDTKNREDRYVEYIKEIKQTVSDGEKSRKSTTIAMWTLAITTILGIAAMVVTVVVSG